MSHAKRSRGNQHARTGREGRTQKEYAARTEGRGGARTPTYLFVVGGVMSGVGKGIASSSIAAVLKARGLSVTALKIDPYINVDAGTMNPTEHGEVFVMDSGLETDQDMGNYERFLNTTLPSINYMTTGSVYQSVIHKERNLEFEGKNVQVVPDIPLEVIRRIEAASAEARADVTIVEVGGTVGEYENILFLEAVRMMRTKYPTQVAVAMVSYLPVPGSIGEMKTKPTQHASRTLNSAGLQADFIIARSKLPLDEKRKEKISTFCNTPVENVVSAPDVDSIYDVPLNFERDKLGDAICRTLDLPCQKADLSAWKKFVKRAKTVEEELPIAVVGKYFETGDFLLGDVYISVLESIKYSCYQQGVKPKIEFVSSRAIERGKRDVTSLKQYAGILVPGGFGSAGVEGKIKVIQYAREQGIPFFGLCYGMQLGVVEFARHVAGIEGAHTAEITKKTPAPVIDVMEHQKAHLTEGRYGGTMRLGSYPCTLKKGTVAARAYKDLSIAERHRHRFEVNEAFIRELEEAGLVFSGTSPDGTLMEIMELPT
ncbi:CTP synthase, partial [Patescibacteria group bacterium]|nr:CTP synthase [Patescibacteria group bacterium]